MSCKDCPYFWKDDDDLYACCHFEHNPHIPAVYDLAPCEQDEEYCVDEDEIFIDCLDYPDEEDEA